MRKPENQDPKCESTPLKGVNLSILWRLTPLIIFIVTILMHSLLFSPLFLENKSFFKYPLAAQNYLDGNLSSERLLDFSPLYLYTNVLARLISSEPLLLIRRMQIILTALSAVFLFLLFKLYFGKAWAILGVIIFVSSHSIINFTDILEPESLLICLLLGFIFFVTIEGKSYKFLAGVLFGMALLTRPSLFLLVFFIPIYFFLNRKDSHAWKLYSLFFLIPVITCVSLLWIRNTLALKKFSPYVMNPGQIFFEGNNPYSFGQGGIYPLLVQELPTEFSQEVDYAHEVYRILARRIEGKDLSIPEVNEYWMKKIENYIFDHPARFLKIVIFKLQFVFHEYQWHDLGSSFGNSKVLSEKCIPTVPFWVISALALVGMCVNSSRWKRDLVFYLIFLIQFGLLLMIYVTERQRLVIIPIFIFFAMHALVWGCKKIKTAIILILVMVPAYFLFCVKNDLIKEEDHRWKVQGDSQYYFTQASLNRNNKQMEKARKDAGLALALCPWSKDKLRPATVSFGSDTFAEFALKLYPEIEVNDTSSLYDKSILLIETGRLEEAEAILVKLISQGHTFKRNFELSSQPYYYLGRIEEIRKNNKKAEEYFANALHDSPGCPFSLSHMYALTGQEIYREELCRYFDRLDAYFMIGRAFLEIEKPKEAIDYLAYVVEKIPEYRRAIIYLAVASGATGQYDIAVNLYIQAIKKSLDPAFFENELVSIFRKWSETKNKNVVAKYYYGLVLYQFGRCEEAQSVLKEAMTISASLSSIQTNIEYLLNDIRAINSKER